MLVYISVTLPRVTNFSLLNLFSVEWIVNDTIEVLGILTLPDPRNPGWFRWWLSMSSLVRIVSQSWIHLSWSFFSNILYQVHPWNFGKMKPFHTGKLTWNLQITCLKRIIIFQIFIFKFHIDFQKCLTQILFQIVQFNPPTIDKILFWTYCMQLGEEKHLRSTYLKRGPP